MEILAFHAFYQADPSAFPMTFQQTVSYVWLQQAFLSLFMLWFFEAEIFNTITTGSIAYELVRPMNLYNRWFCQSAANRLAKAVLRCGPIFVIAFTASTLSFNSASKHRCLVLVSLVYGAEFRCSDRYVAAGLHLNFLYIILHRGADRHQLHR